MKELHEALNLVIQAGKTKKGSFALEVNCSLQSAIFIHHADCFTETKMIFTYFDSVLSTTESHQTVPFSLFSNEISAYLAACV